MKLTKLEIKGFKSFADKTIIDFQEGITAIVGPNGCGKSNIVDAIRWVLGEQSTKALRSEKMENIIFNGTQKRKAVHLAEVSLSFENTKNILATEYTSVTITRKLYRSGESEYRLNDINCRLKDITDLFLDTGIGSDSYSIIELKMVEELISNKEGSRRALFEAAAGTGKYRIRKKQTFVKLKDTEEDLSRIEDLLFEIEKNLKTLESQARKSERFYKLKEQYKSGMIQIAVKKIQTKEIDGAILSNKEIHISDEIVGDKTKVETYEAAIEKEKLKLLTLEKQVGVQQKSVFEITSRIQRLENEQNLKKEKIKNLDEKITKVKDDYQSNQVENQKCESLIEELSLSIDPEKISLKEKETKINDFEEILKSLDQKQKIKKLEFDETKLIVKTETENLYRIEKELDRYVLQSESFENDIHRIELESNEGELEISKAEERLEKLNRLITENSLLLSKKQAEEKNLGTLLEELQQKLENKKNEYSILVRQNDAHENEFKITKNLVENLEGFPESIRYLRKNASWLKDTPLLSDLISCSEEFKIALENYFGNFMNYFVVNSRDQAVRSIKLLEQNKEGRAGFFILDEINISVENSFKSPTEIGIPLIQLVETEDLYNPLIHSLLGNTQLIKAETSNTFPNSLKNLFENTLEKPIFLEESGTFFTSLTQISGGSIGAFEGKKIGRTKVLKNLEHTLLEEKLKIQELKMEEEKISTSILSTRLDLKSINLQDSFTELTRNDSERKGVISLITNLKTKVSLLKTRKLEILNKKEMQSKNAETIFPEILKRRELIREKEVSLDSLGRELDFLRENQASESRAFNRCQVEWHQLKNKVNLLERDININRERGFQLKTKSEKLIFEINLIVDELASIKVNDNPQDIFLMELYAEKETMESGLIELEEEYQGQKVRVQEKEKNILELRKRKEDLENQLQILKEKRTNFQFECKQIIDRIMIEFSISEKDWEELFDENKKVTLENKISKEKILLSEEEISNEDKISSEDKLFHKEEISEENEIVKETIQPSILVLEEQMLKLKKQLDNFGPINPLAMEAFNEIKTRFDFIGSQKEDLIKAKTSLLETIQEIDETAKEKFMSAFTTVRENFIKVFRTLFNEEDSCDLILLQPEDPLESDIEILARPKGKRPLTINQLSGGEKTLTSTAILFSLYLLKPAPFCIFDEVDAPLDDSNIDKFNRIIRDFSEHSQFIIVSHNKKTISSTDILYGVTMVEPGVSKVVTVDLRKVESAA